LSATAPLPGRLTRTLAALFLGLGLLAAARADDAKKKQEIIWPEIARHSAGDTPFQLTAHATSKLPVAYEIISGPADLDGNLVKLSGQSGLVIVRASQKGNDIFLPAPLAERVIRVGERPSPPVVVEQPMDSMVGIGELVMLSAEFRGEPIPTLQWQKNGTNLPGATERTFTLSAATPADAGSYDVVATNPLGVARTAAVRVSVGKRHQTIQFDAPSTVMAGQTIMLSATASSGLLVHYTLLSGSGSISGGTITAQPGTIVVQAEQAGDSTYEAATPVTQSFQIQQAPGGQFR
jgi:large repetitive protein